MTRVAATDDRINVIKLKSRYPQGAEKMLIYATTGRKVPPGKLPADVGVIVMKRKQCVFYIGVYQDRNAPYKEKGHGGRTFGKKTGQCGSFDRYSHIGGFQLLRRF